MAMLSGGVLPREGLDLHLPIQIWLHKMAEPKLWAPVGDQQEQAARCEDPVGTNNIPSLVTISGS